MDKGADTPRARVRAALAQYAGTEWGAAAMELAQEHPLAARGLASVLRRVVSDFQRADHASTVADHDLEFANTRRHVRGAGAATRTTPRSAQPKRAPPSATARRTPAPKRARVSAAPATRTPVPAAGPTPPGADPARSLSFECDSQLDEIADSGSSGGVTPLTQRSVGSPDAVVDQDNDDDDNDNGGSDGGGTRGGTPAPSRRVATPMSACKRQLADLGRSLPSAPPPEPEAAQSGKRAAKASPGADIRTFFGGRRAS